MYRLGMGSAVSVSGVQWLSGCMKHDMNPGSNAYVTVVEAEFGQALPLPSTVFNPEGYTLRAGRTSANILAGKSSPVLSYTPNALLAPLFRVEKGRRFKVQVNNQTGEKSNVHWHGLLIPATMDGHPEATITNGDTFPVEFVVNQRAGTYWYHPHPHGATGRQVYMGLAGLLIVQDDEEAALGLPKGEYELPLLLSDKRLTTAGVLQYNPSMSEIMTGFMGETVTVNGVAGVVHEVAPTLYRLRVLNASNARIYNLGFSQSQTFTVIGSDGGLLAAPRQVSNLLLSPGERADLLVDFSSFKDQSVLLRSETFTEGGEAQGQQAFSVMKFMVSKKGDSGSRIPSALPSITALPGPATTRTFTLDMANGSGGHGGHGSGKGMHRINDKVYDAKRVDQVVKAGDTELWIFDNSNGDEPHPMHLHGVQFRVIGRTGARSVQPHESGWKDTVLVAPGEVVRVQMAFPSHPGRFVMHCHNLEHEDDGMMLQFEIK